MGTRLHDQVQEPVAESQWELSSDVCIVFTAKLEGFHLCPCCCLGNSSISHDTCHEFYLNSDLTMNRDIHALSYHGHLRTR